MNRFVGKVAISSIFDRFVACFPPPGAVGARRFEGLCRPVAACGARLDALIEEFGWLACGRQKV